MDEYINDFKETWVKLAYIRERRELLNQQTQCCQDEEERKRLETEATKFLAEERSLLKSFLEKIEEA